MSAAQNASPNDQAFRKWEFENAGWNQANLGCHHEDVPMFLFSTHHPTQDMRHRQEQQLFEVLEIESPLVLQVLGNSSYTSSLIFVSALAYKVFSDGAETSPKYFAALNAVLPRLKTLLEVVEDRTAANARDCIVRNTSIKKEWVQECGEGA